MFFDEGSSICRTGNLQKGSRKRLSQWPDLLLVNDPGCQGLLRDLTIVDFLLHGTLGQEAVDVHRFRLAEPVDPKHRLNIMGRVPASIKDDDTVGGAKVDAQTSGSG